MTKENLVKEGLDIKELFKALSENGKNMALAYLSALRDKEISQTQTKQQAG